MNTYEIAALERRMFRFLSSIPEDSSISHFYNSETGKHRFFNFMNDEALIEKLELSREEWQYLLAQYRLTGPDG